MAVKTHPVLGIEPPRQPSTLRCLVSIPPVLRGEAFAASDPSSLHQRLIRSWLQAGFEPVSINTAFELDKHPDHHEHLKALGVGGLVVPATEGNYPPYLPNLRLALELAAERYPGEVLAITNADIFIDLDDSSHHQLRLLRHDGFLMAHRTDIDDDTLFGLSPAERRQLKLCEPFVAGIDFIAARSETMRLATDFLSPDLTIGLPWWDLLLPMALFAVGATRSFLASDQFLHLKHEERWDPRWLDQVGTRATRYLHRTIKTHKAPASAFVWASAYSQLVSPLQTLSAHKSRWITRFEHIKQGRHCPAYLFDVLRMTEGLVCEQSWELDRRWIGTWY
jgi:hypothetical protein